MITHGQFVKDVVWKYSLHVFQKRLIDLQFYNYLNINHTPYITEYNVFNDAPCPSVSYSKINNKDYFLYLYAQMRYTTLQGKS